MIVVGGEGIVDLVPAAGSGEPDAPLLPRWGGGPYNTAIALGRLGARAAFLSRMSLDPFGTAMLERLRRDGVDTSLVQRGPEPTSLAVVGVEPSGAAHYAFHMEGTAERLVEDPGPLPPETRAVALGTLGVVLEPGAASYAAVLRREADAGRLISVDPNIRAALIGEPDAHRERLRSWLPRIGLLKLSEEDSAWLGVTDPAEWVRAGVSAVVLTRGARGMLAVTPTTRVEMPAVPVPVVDTIGAGDTVHAAVLARLQALGALDRDVLAGLDADTWHDVLSRAALAASWVCSRAGAHPPVVAGTRHDADPTGMPG